MSIELPNINLSAGNVEGTTVQGGYLGQSRYHVLGGGVGADPGRGEMGRDGTVVDNPAALRVLLFHEAKAPRVHRKIPVRLV